jgi:hypothetical protein
MALLNKYWITGAVLKLFDIAYYSDNDAIEYQQ